MPDWQKGSRSRSGVTSARGEGGIGASPDPFQRRVDRQGRGTLAPSSQGLTQVLLHPPPQEAQSQRERGGRVNTRNNEKGMSVPGNLISLG